MKAHALLPHRMPRIRMETIDVLVCAVAAGCAIAGYLLYYDLVTSVVY